MRPTSADASECYENYIEELKKQGFQLRECFTPETTQLASGKLQAVRSIYPCRFALLIEYFNRSRRRKEWELGKGVEAEGRALQGKPPSPASQAVVRGVRVLALNTTWPVMPRAGLRLHRGDKGKSKMGAKEKDGE